MIDNIKGLRENTGWPTGHAAGSSVKPSKGFAVRLALVLKEVMNTVKIVAMGGLALILVACGSAKDASKSNFSKTIQTYMDTQNGLCAAIPAREVPFKLENQGVFSKENKKRADALVDAGLLSKRDTEVKAMFGNRMEPATEYQLSDPGKKYLVAKQDAFCTGKYVMVEVDNYTEPGDMMGVKMSQVNFRYKVKDVADWANAEGVRATYKSFADQSKGDDIQGKAALILTNDGWLHERLFKS